MLEKGCTCEDDTYCNYYHMEAQSLSIFIYLFFYFLFFSKINTFRRFYEGDMPTFLIHKETENKHCLSHNLLPWQM